ncbi:proline--tRNA ligase [Candidatus Peregrinibacteria bacterium]|nr:proline--tRNA ligase [Candidatus Peregrinibacteria bacterium]
MKYSNLVGKTRLDAPSDADSVNARLLTQAGFVEKLAAGIYNYLPMGKKVLDKVCDIIRDEMNKVDGQELFMPILHPVSIWETTGRIKTMDDVLYKTKGAGDKDFVLGPSHEETVTPLLRDNVNSYKDLPLSVYQLATKFRDEPRAKSGVLRGREFGMKDMYSFHLTEEDLDEYYERVSEAYFNVFKRCGLKSHIIEASGGAFSDKFSHEFSVETPAGEDTIIVCEKCNTAQNLEIAEGKIVGPDEKEEEERALEMVEAKRGFSVEENAKLHSVPESKILKSVVYEVEEVGLLGVAIRGDLNVSEVKLENYLKKQLRPASPELLKKHGLVQGFISPVNMPEESKIPYIADHSITNIKNFVTGANQPEMDYVNVNLGRDFQIDDFTDLVEVKSGFECNKCSSPLTEMKAIEVGNIFKLGSRYTDAFKFKLTGKDGTLKTVYMGCYGIGTTRLVGTVVEASHDENGIIWPKSVAPYMVHLLTIGNDDNVNKHADEIYNSLKEQGIEILFDDRDESPGVKLKDADLIGIPLRLVVSKRTLSENSVEWKVRAESDSKNIRISDLDTEIQDFLSN